MVRKEVKKEIHDGLSRHLRSLIFGSEDGIISSGGLILGVSAATHDPSLVIIAAIVAAVPGALSMAAGDYLGSKSQREVQESRVLKLQKDVLRGSKKIVHELKQRYLQEGFTAREISPWLRRLGRNKELLLRKYEEECGCLPETFERPFINALSMFISFLIGAFLPLIPFLAQSVFSLSAAQILSFCIDVLSLFIIGAVKTRFTLRPWWKSGIEMLLVGLGAAILGYILGLLLGLR